MIWIVFNIALFILVYSNVKDVDCIVICIVTH